MCITKDITPNNFKEPRFQDPSRNCFAIKTGSISGITVFDFDSLYTYIQALQSYPELKKHYHVRSRRGYHVYFLYDERFKNSINVTNIEDKGMDIRTDGGIIFAPPTIYLPIHVDCPFGRFSYDEVGGSLLPIPDSFIRACQFNDRAWKSNKLSLTKEKQTLNNKIFVEADVRHGDILCKTTGSYIVNIITENSDSPFIYEKKNIISITKERCGISGSIDICSILVLNDQLKTIEKYSYSKIVSMHFINNYTTQSGDFSLDKISQVPTIINADSINYHMNVSANGIITTNGNENNTFTASSSGNIIVEALNSARVVLLKNQEYFIFYKDPEVINTTNIFPLHQ